jgi:hypothetical protein
VGAPRTLSAVSGGYRVRGAGVKASNPLPPRFAIRGLRIESAVGRHAPRAWPRFRRTSADEDLDVECIYMYTIWFGSLSSAARCGKRALGHPGPPLLSGRIPNPSARPGVCFVSQIWLPRSLDVVTNPMSSVSTSFDLRRIRFQIGTRPLPDRRGVILDRNGLIMHKIAICRACFEADFGLLYRRTSKIAA